MKYLCVDLCAHNSGQFHVEKILLTLDFFIVKQKQGVKWRKGLINWIKNQYKVKLCTLPVKQWTQPLSYGNSCINYLQNSAINI